MPSSSNETADHFLSLTGLDAEADAEGAGRLTSFPGAARTGTRSDAMKLWKLSK